MWQTKKEEIFVSIVVPTYNRASIIHRAINSIKQQTFLNWECIIVDDKSTDNTDETVCNLIGGDKRFVYLKNIREKGAPGARNTGILASHGEYVVLFDSDNVMHPDFIEKVYTSLKENDVDVCSSFSSVIDNKTGLCIGSFRWIGYGKVHRAVLKEKSYFDNSSTLIRKVKLLEIGLLDEKCPSFQEWDTHIRLSKNASYATVEEELIDYYRGGEDTISKGKVRSINGRIYILNKFKTEFLCNVPIVYLLNCFSIFCKIKDLEDDYHDEYLSLKKVYRKTFGVSVSIIVRFLYILRYIKKLYIRKNNYRHI